MFNRAEYDVTARLENTRDDFHEYIRQCIALEYWLEAARRTLQDERAGIISKDEADKWIATFNPHIDALLLRGAEAAGVLA